MAFPDDPLEHRTQVAFGADVTADPGTWVWTDATPSLLDQQIRITRGRQAESGAVTPGSISVVLDNPAGDFTPELATGVHYPHVVPGVPMRESLRGSTMFIELPGSGARISTPDGAGLGITGDFDLRIDLTLTQWRLPGHQVVLMSKAGAGTDQSWELGITGSGRLYVMWRESTSSQVSLSSPSVLVIPPSGRLAVRAAVDVDDGAGGLVVYFWTAPTLAGPWTELGDGVPLAGASALWPSTAPVEVGDLTHPMLTGSVPPVGRLHGLQVRDGIDGTVVADFDSADVAEDAATFTGTDGRTWTVTAPAAATRWVPRITGAVTEWAPTWPYGDLSDEDAGDPGDAQVAVQAMGPLQRLGAGQPALASTLRRRVPTDPAILAYWPLEDGASSTQAGSGLPGGTPMRLTGVTWASDDSLPGSAALPVTGSSAMLSASVPAPAGTPDGWRVELVYRADTAPAQDAELITVQLSGTMFSRLRISLSGSNFVVTYRYADGTTPDDISTVPAPNALETWNRLVLYARQVTATTMALHFGVITIGGTVYGVDSATFAGTIGRVIGLTGSYGAAIEGLRIGHVAVFAVAETAIFNGADNAFDGELATERMIRLCAEESVPLLVCGDTTTTAAMGPQGMDTLLALLQECADTDGGVLGEQRDRLGLRHRTLASFCDQVPVVTLDARAGEIVNPFSPVSSDESLRNQITATRSGGSSAIVDDPASIARSGLKPGRVDVNPETDEQLPDIAGWALRLGTAPGMRYPQLSVDLALAPRLVDAWLQMDSGDLAKVTDLPPQHPTDTVQALMQGYVETYSATDWIATANCTPGGPWQVGVLGEDAHWDTAGSTLSIAVEADTTTIQVASTGVLWTTDPADYPLTLRLGGEVVTATACTGTSSPQTMTVTRAVNGVVRGWSAGTDVRLAVPLIYALR